MYTFDSRIRYSETDSKGNLSLEGLLDYFQDCSTFHSEDLGVGLEYLKTENLVWVLSSWQIVTESYPKLCDRVTVGTFPCEFKGCFGSRNFFMKDEGGNFLAKANTLWTLLDTQTMRPSKPTPLMLEKYVLEEKLDMEYAPRKIAIPEEGTEGEPIEVRPQHLDTNHHVNNGQYVRMAMDFLPDGFGIGQMRAEYKKQAHLKDILYPFVAMQEKVCVVSLRGEDGSAYVNVEFQKKQ